MAQSSLSTSLQRKQPSVLGAQPVALRPVLEEVDVLDDVEVDTELDVDVLEEVDELEEVDVLELELPKRGGGVGAVPL